VTFTPPLSREQIEQILPHRPPFLLIDEVLELEPGLRAVAQKHVVLEDWWFPGHFPGRPVMPGVLTVEAMAQTGAVATLVDERYAGKIAFFAGIDACRFKRIVEPGDTLRLECELVKLRGPVGRGRATAHVGDELAAEANLSFFVGSE
jgi:3-hydroxyacyl-[acyl-carrier-protein] dehydratase